MHDHLIHNYNESYNFKNVECLIHLIRRLKKSKEETSHNCQEQLIILLKEMNDKRNKLIKEEVYSFDKEYLKMKYKNYDEIKKKHIR